MKTKIRLLASALYLLFVQLSPNLAHAGKSSGGGNGDAAFALQEAANQNPGLPLQQLLMKLFNDSENQVPEIVITRRERRVEFGRFLPEGGAGLSWVAYFPNTDSSLDVYFETDFYTKANINLTRQIQDRGPLDPQRNLRGPWKVEMGGWFYNTTPVSTGFVLSNSEGSIEFRQYTPELTLFALYPSKDGHCWNSGVIYQPGSRRACGIGYFW